MSERRMIQISRPSFGEEEYAALKAPLDSGWVTQGPRVKQFETDFAARHNVKHALAVSNCTTALHLALVAAGVGPGDEVIVPAFTWVATANAVLYCNAKPVFADIELSTFNLDPGKLKDRITSRTKAVIPVHLFGLCMDVEHLQEIAPGIAIIEDGACAAGASLRNKPAGSLGDIGCFSFHPRKSITTGEGGMLTTNNGLLKEKMDQMRNHGASVSEEQRHHGPRPYILPGFSMVGYNYRMTDLQGALGVEQLKKLDAFISERNKWASFYESELSVIPWLKTPSVAVDQKHGWQSYVLLIDENKSPMKRNELMDHLLRAGISTRPGTHAVHMLEYYSETYGLKPSDLPESRKANDLSMAIPLHNKMTEEDYKHIVNVLKKV